ncbi:CRK3 [Symbiodinium sp. CCMP2592]|nr:CRK3 [Symbiodinium sp. CCMP2592]
MSAGKTVATYKILLQNYSIVDIQDVSPGSGALGSAALALGIPITSFVFDDTHLVWLQNVADLQCARLICDKNQNLYQQTLAEALQNWFGDDLALDRPVKKKGEEEGEENK